MEHFITNILEPAILSLLGLIVTAAVAYITALLKKKFGLEISTATQDRIRTIALDAVHAVEEQAATFAKNSSRKWSAESKHGAAVDMILSRVPTLTQAEADNLVQSSIAMVRGMGATKQLGA